MSLTGTVKNLKNREYRVYLDMNDYKYPPFHGVEFFHDKETIKT